MSFFCAKNLVYSFKFTCLADSSSLKPSFNRLNAFYTT
ncbi:hypothetical protein BVRB_6g141560 [Beta vulgaris subsp. vulgaris]|nr:hypothetical protein BVRB_6g141560 [Beta vulgaris subsp. vulgaris]